MAAEEGCELMSVATSQVQDVSAPGPGLYPGVPHPTYRRWRAASQSILKIIRDRSPAHAYLEMVDPSPPTPAQIFGEAVHAAVLQPDLFRARYLRAPEIDRRTKAGRELWEELQAEHPGAIILRPEEYDRCLAIRSAVAAHPTARKLIGGEAEVSAVWRDRATGVLCKGRFDSLDTRLGIITDLKTTHDASRGAFSRTIWTYGYYLQAAHYLTGANTLGLSVRWFTFIAVEQEPPYAVAVYHLSDAALMAGEGQLGELLEIYKRCEETGIWPGYPDEAQEISLPTWAWYQIDPDGRCGT